VPLTLACLYLAYCGVACSLQDRIVFPGPVLEPTSDPKVPFGGERLAVPVDGGEVEAWFFRGKGVTADNPGPTVLFAHGNAETIDAWAYLIDSYMLWGVNLLLVEYRGYGRSAGRATQQGLIDDALRFYDQVVARPDVDPDRIVLHGRSIGSGVVAAVSRQRPARLLILQSAFYRFSELSWQFLAPPFLVDEVFDNPTAVREFKGPILLLHGLDDPIFTFDHAERLRALSDDAILQPMECEHNDCAVQIMMTVIARRLVAEGLTEIDPAVLHYRRFMSPKPKPR
jgi:fermentation-respiration switch protein FrsA (DUF1100 family)